MKLNSRWSYVVCGVNIAFAFIGALLHNLPLLLIGVFFGFWNWTVAETNRRIEDESIKSESSAGADKTEE